MNATDVEIKRTVMREFGKRPVDSSRLDVQVVQGRVTLAGIIGQLRDQPDIDLRDEVDTVMKLLTRDRLIREISNNARLIIPEKEHETDTTRGRSRR